MRSDVDVKYITDLISVNGYTRFSNALRNDPVGEGEVCKAWINYTLQKILNSSLPIHRRNAMIKDLNVMYGEFNGLKHYWLEYHGYFIDPVLPEFRNGNRIFARKVSDSELKYENIKPISLHDVLSF